MARQAPSRIKDGPWVPLDDQVEQIVARLEPAAEALNALCWADGTRSGLMLVRYYNEDPTDHAKPRIHLGQRILKVLVTVGADTDVDEYDVTGLEE